jgi:hypothetical protein
MNTLNMRTSIRAQHHHSVNLTEIVDRDLKKVIEVDKVARATQSIEQPNTFGLDEHGWFVSGLE